MGGHDAVSSRKTGPGQASKRESSTAREFLAVACAVVAAGSELDLSSSPINQPGGLGLPSLSLSVLSYLMEVATPCLRTN